MGNPHARSGWSNGSRRQGRRAVLAALLLSACPLGGEAQVVRGTARERSSGAPVAGVLITLEPADSASSGAQVVERSALTDAMGSYAIRAPGPGRYRITAKRIGLQRHVSDLFRLAVGETRTIDLELDAILQTLDQVVVMADAMCVRPADQARAVAFLWDDIRTALAATGVTVRERLATGRIARYVRLVDARSLRVLQETREEHSGTIGRPFASPEPDSLSVHGYWRQLPGGTMAFFGPDHEVLLSESFQRDHCFGIASPRDDRRGLAGLEFTPASGRRTPDIRGTIWIDGQARELRSIDFQYTMTGGVEHVEKIGGEVHFTRLSTGAWIVHRWFIRMPAFAFMPKGLRLDEAPGGGAQYARAGQLVEEGGDVTSDLLVSGLRPLLSGTVLDSLGAPLAGARVGVEGTSVEARTDSAGVFYLAGVGEGTYRLVVEDAGYARYGVPAGAAEISASSELARRIVIRAPDTEALAARMCGGRAPEGGRVALRIVVAPDDAGRSLATQTLRLGWIEYELGDVGGLTVPRVRRAHQDATTDATGGVTFCGVQGGALAELGFPVGDGDIRSLASVAVPEDRVALVLVTRGGG